jgi:uncharacterized membrane protein YjjP (DUF1212 family)
MRYTDAFLIALVPLVAGFLAIAVARIRRANTYSPILALGIMLILSGVVIEATVLALSVLSLIF